MTVYPSLIAFPESKILHYIFIGGLKEAKEVFEAYNTSAKMYCYFYICNIWVNLDRIC